MYELSPASFERYIEVFGGGGWVLFGRPPDPKVMEVYNDFISNLTIYMCEEPHQQSFISWDFCSSSGRDEFLVLRKGFRGQEVYETF